MILLLKPKHNNRRIRPKFSEGRVGRSRLNLLVASNLLIIEQSSDVLGHSN